MGFEVELKFPVSGLEPVVGRLRALGCEIDDGVRQLDTYLTHPARDVATTDEAIRLRSEGEANYLTYKGPKIDSMTSTRYELELALPEGAQWMSEFAHLLGVLGFGVVLRMRKVRRRARLVWNGTEVEVSLDQVEGLGIFAELESYAENEGLLDAARRAVTSLADWLGLSGAEQRNYYELLLNRWPDRLPPDSGQRWK